MSQIAFTPEFSALIEAPEGMLSTAALVRIHKRVAKAAMIVTLKAHDLKFIPMHFRAGNWKRYDHAKRKEGYLAAKKRRHLSPIDLVKYGETKRAMEAEYPKITVRGSADREIVGKLTKKFPHPIKENPAGIGAPQMVREIETWHASEIKAAADQYQASYVELIVRELSTRKKLKKRLGPAIAAAGSSIGG